MKLKEGMHWKDKDFCVYIVYLNAYFQFWVHNNSYIYRALISVFVIGEKGLK